jgi:hypothetical protein
MSPDVGLTDVSAVLIGFGTPSQAPLRNRSVAQLEALTFPPARWVRLPISCTSRTVTAYTES